MATWADWLEAITPNLTSGIQAEIDAALVRIDALQATGDL